MNKKIITIAEIVFALIFVVLLAVFMATINSKGNSANNQLVNTLESTDATSLQNYNGTTVKGSTVVTALGNYKSIGGDAKLTLTVITLQDTDGTDYGYDALGKELSAYNANPSDDEYINPSANFDCELVYNGNDVVTGITFTQQALD